MSSNELIIDDDYCQLMENYFVNEGERLDGLINEYTAIMYYAKDSAIVSGEVSDALSVYITYLEFVNDKIKEISSSLKNQISQFLQEVDNADQYLF